MKLRDFLPTDDPDESIFVFVRPYFLSFLPWFALGVGLLLVGLVFIIITIINFPDLVASGLSHDILVVMSSVYFLTLIPFFTVAFLDYYYDIQIVTDHRLIDIDQIGLFRREINELDLSDVQDVSSGNKGILSSFFDFGQVSVETAGAKERFVFDNILHPRDIASIILDLSSQVREVTGEQEHTPLTPIGRVKGVINGVVYHSTKDLAQIGVMAPERIPQIEAKNPVAIQPTKEVPKTPLSQTKLVSQTPPPSIPQSSPGDIDITIDEPPPKK